MGRIKVFIKKITQIIKRPSLRFLYHNSIGKGVEVCKGAYVTHSHIGEYCYLGMYSYFNHVKMGSYCSIAGNVTIGAMEHDYTSLSTSTHLSDSGFDDKITSIGDDVWIGAQCVIRQGISIGTGAVIGANSFVNKDIPPFSIAFGTPAKVYKMRFESEEIDRILQSKYWSYSPKKAQAIICDIKEKNNENRI